ncbi:DUF924 domain-containing protein [Undibacterium sp. Jales W-56]|uniref:DUF924 family protein n=1 Tax=Undibacterium sp. Jales W-56 TaxID=2897325 RepID=UPI0021D28A53|nr:DUF924 family protein [Undibacterium sp. Jales W-56]MCU6435417.1 DUF924 domain-containing protein [Undibacterium sp. Jales W-56]
METSVSIKAFWFGDQADDAITAATQAKLWWSKNADLDQLITQRFAGVTEQVASGALDSWKSTPDGCLSLILLCDQFPRNMYRGTPRAFAYDALARSLCRDGLASGYDRQLRLIERVFFYLPLEHSESMEDQDRAVALFTSLSAVATEQQQSLFDGYLKYAIRHREVIARFGRFPHRNQILGRASTPEEILFLSEPGSSF